jgi:hypothetical protein
MTQPTELMRTSVFITLLAIITLLGAALRLYDLAEPSLWADEMFTIRDALASAPLGYRSTRIGLELSGVDVSAIGSEAYHTFRAHGMNEWNMRIGSCVLGCLAIPLLGFFSAGFFSRRTALIFALLVSVDPWHLLWSQHARFYAPMFLYFALSLVLYYSAISDSRIGRSRIKLAIAMLFVVAAVSVKLTSNLVLGIIGLDLAIEWIRSRKMPLPPASLVIVGAGGLFCLYLTGLSVIGEAGGINHFLGRALGDSPVRVVTGNLYLTGFPIAIMAIASGMALWCSQRRLVIFLASVVVVPLAAFSILSLVSHVEPRYTFVTTFGWLALASLGLGWLWENTSPRLGLVAACVPLTLILGSIAKDDLVYYNSGYGNRARWRHAFDYVQRNRLPGENVISHEMWAGQFHLQDPSVLQVGIDFCVPGSGRCVRPNPEITSWDQLQSDTWFVVKGTRFDLDEGRAHWLEGRATLRAIYPNRIPFPQETVRVYHYQSTHNGQREDRS